MPDDPAASSPPSVSAMVHVATWGYGRQPHNQASHGRRSGIPSWTPASAFPLSTPALCTDAFLSSSNAVSLSPSSTAASEVTVKLKSPSCSPKKL